MDWREAFQRFLMLRSCSIVFALVMTSCAGLRAPEPEVRAGLRGATDELIRRGELATAEQMLGASAEVTESEFAQIYMLLAQAAEAKGDPARAEHWARKSLALAKFRIERGNPLPLPADLPTTQLP